MRLLHFKRDGADGLVAGMETNLLWVKRAELEKRQIGGFLDGLEEAGNGATEFLGGLFGGGSASSTTAPTEGDATTTVPAKPISTEEPTTRATSNPAITTSPASTRAAITTSPTATSQKPETSISAIIESITSSRTSAISTLSEGTSSTTTTSVSSLKPTITSLTSTLTTSTLKPAVTENPVAANTLTETSDPEGNKTNVTTIVVSIVVIIFGSIAILSAAYFVSKRYIRRRKLAGAGDETPLPTPPMKPMDARFAPGFEQGPGVPVSRNF